MEEEIEEGIFLERLTKLMEENNVSRKKLSEGTGIPVNTIDNWFKRNENNPKMATLVSIADFFNVSLYYLCGKSENKDIVDKKNPFAKYLKDGEMLAFHLTEGDASDLTEDEIKEVVNFINFVRSKRDNENK